MWDIIKDVLMDTLVDTLKILPILFIAYFLMELLEHKAGDRSKELIRKSGRFGPVCGAVLGMLPQCGFSAAASSFYAGRVITVGTLVAVYLSTSDEMLPIFISENVPAATIFKILGLKVLFGLIAGFIIDAGVRLFRSRHDRPADDKMDIHHVCEHDHAHEESDSILISALKHTLKITVFLLLVSLVLNAVIAFVGEERLSHLIIAQPVVGELIAGLIGLIPNCAASVVITELYLEGIIGAGPMMAGLLVGAGIGLIVLFRENDNIKKNFTIVGMLYGFGVLFGVIIDLLGVTL